MNIEDLIHGESKNIEYKEMLPSNSDKYTKTVVAFANTQGGKNCFCYSRWHKLNCRY